MKKTYLAALLTLGVPLMAVAADSPDSSFYKNAAEGGIAEVDAGKLAEQKANSQAVKEFGAQMVKDHSAVNEKLKSLAASKDISLPTSASVGEMAEKAKLEVLSGDTFDKSYIKGQIQDHRDTIAMFKKEASQGKDPAARALAAATLPTLEEHMRKIDKIAAAEGVSK